MRRTRRRLFTAFATSFVLSVVCIFGQLATVSAADYTLVDVNKQYQKFDGWGTSLAWWADAVGGWTMEGVSGKEKREEIMDLVFSQEGLNLNIARYNLGGGENPDHAHMIDHRQMPGYKAGESSDYDWSADANQVWVLREANRLQGANMINEMFVNSPPYWMTESGCASGATNKSQENLAPERYEDFVKYIVDVLKHLIEEENIPFDYVEPLNEPASSYWGAGGSQEGCLFKPGEHQSAMYTLIKEELEKQGLWNLVDIAATDETNTDTARDSWRKVTDAAKAVISKINTHTYSYASDSATFLRDAAYGETANFAEPDYKLWMSEVCYGSGEADDHDSMKFALDLGDNINKSINEMRAGAWVVWQAVESELSNVSYGNNYGLIHGIYQDVGNTEYGIDMDSMAWNRGDYSVTKQYYVMGQYSKYIQRGYTIVDSGDDDTVAAVSPDGDKLVLVVKNNGGRKRISYQFKGFEGASAFKVVTSASKNWETTAFQSTYGVNDVVEADSVTTYVVSGNRVENANNASGMVEFNSLTAAGTQVRAAYTIKDTTADYKLYYANTFEQLKDITAETTSVQIDKAKSTVIFDKGGGGKIFAIIEATKAGEKFYTNIINAEPDAARGENFAYFIDCGRPNQASFGNEIGEFSAYQSLANQAFGEDELTGYSWGYEEPTDGGFSNGSLWDGAIYTGNGKPLTYKLQVDDDTTSHTIMLGFKDPWSVGGRAMDVFINGSTESSGYIADTTKQGVISVGNVKGVAEGDQYFITVTLKKGANNTAGDVVLNFMAVQTDDMREKVLNDSISLNVEQGQTVLDKLPDTVELVTTKGVKTYDVTYGSVNYSTLQSANTGTPVNAYIEELDYSFQMQLLVTPAGVKYFYYINCGHSLPGSSDPDYQAIRMMYADTLINGGDSQLDQQSANESQWGYLKSDAANWTNDADRHLSLRQGDSASSTLVYRLPGLKAAPYILELGFKNPDGWGSRTMDVYINDVKYTSVSLTSGWQTKTVEINFAQETDNQLVTVRLDGSAHKKANPFLGYLIVKQAVGANPDGDKPVKPEIPKTVSASATELTVKSLMPGAILTLTDIDNRCLVEYLVESGVTEKTFTGLNLAGAQGVKAVQYYNFQKSQEATADIPSVELSAPRQNWSTDPDTILVTPNTMNGVYTLSYRYGESGEWVNIKPYKYVRAKSNGTYYVRLVTKTGDEVISSVTVERVETFGFSLKTDLAKWTNEDLTLTAEISVGSEVQSVTANDTDITATGNSGKYTYKVSENASVTFRVTTVNEIYKEYTVDVTHIDKAAPTVSVELENHDGVTKAGFAVTSASPYTLKCTADGAISEILTEKFTFTGDGLYTFTVENAAGSIATQTVAFFGDAGRSDNLTASLGEPAGGKLTVSLTSKKSGTMTLRRAGGDADIAIADGKAVLTENGTYLLTFRGADGAVEAVVFAVDSFRHPNQITGGEEMAEGLSAVAVGLISGAAAIAVGAVAVIVLFVRKRRKA